MPDPRYGVVMLGYGGSGHDGAYLTDSIIVAIVDPTKKTVALLSIPRDTWVPLQFDEKNPEYSRINAAYAFAKDSKLYPDRSARYTGDEGPGNLVMDTLSRVLGVPMRYYVAIDFDGFRKMIDAVGGVDVEVQSSFSARYPVNDNPNIDAGWTVVHFQQGQEHMSGARAIQFARARITIDNPTEGSDFGRSRRQLAIIQAFKSRLFQPGGLIRIPQLLSLASQHIATNYGLPSATELSSLLLDWENVSFYQVGLTTGNYLEAGTGPQGAYVLAPNAPKQSWTQIQAFTHHLWQDPALGVELANTEIRVVNNANVAGIASKIGTSLEQLGYRIGGTSNGSTQTASRVIDRTGGKADRVIAQLQRDLGTTLQVVTEEANTWAPHLVLEVGADDAQLASLQVPANRDAPSSSVGIATAGRWEPATPAPDPSDPHPPANPSLTTTPEPSLSPLATDTPIPPGPQSAPEETPMPTPAPSSQEAVLETNPEPTAIAAPQ